MFQLESNLSLARWTDNSVTAISVYGSSENCEGLLCALHLSTYFLRGGGSQKNLEITKKENVSEKTDAELQEMR